jgi:saccharopine dehydrogenase-like NADP-dependent oxidoreductase
MKTVLLLLSTDRFSFPLIRYLLIEGKRYGWKVCIGSMFEPHLIERIKEEEFSNEIIFINITDFRQCDQAIRKSDLVMAMVPDVTLLQIADSCITHQKSLMTPSRLTRQMASKRARAEENNVLLLVECGFSPGLDHITAKKAIDNIQSKGGKIYSFKTYSGSQIAEHCIDNPLEFKLTEPSVELIALGRGNNRHLMHDQLQHVPYHQLLDRAEPVAIRGVGNISAIPEGDALYYRKLYGLTDACTVVKGKFLRKQFEHIWNLIVKLGLTDTTSKIDLLGKKSFHFFLDSLLPYSPECTEIKLRKYLNADQIQIEGLQWLGLFDDQWIEGHKEITAATILQHLLDKKLVMQPEDKDSIIMRHELEYSCATYQHKFTATLIAQGEDLKNSATAKAIGLTAGAAAKAFLLGNIKLKGLHTPTKQELYDPILNELDDLGVAFHIEESRIAHLEADPMNRLLVVEK